MIIKDFKKISPIFFFLIYILFYTCRTSFFILSIKVKFIYHLLNWWNYNHKKIFVKSFLKYFLNFIINIDKQHSLNYFISIYQIFIFLYSPKKLQSLVANVLNLLSCLLYMFPNFFSLQYPSDLKFLT